MSEVTMLGRMCILFWDDSRNDWRMLNNNNNNKFLYCIEIVTSVKYSGMKYMEYLSRRVEMKMSTKFSTCGESNKRAAADVECRLIL
jgi:hypothetical protein